MTRTDSARQSIYFWPASNEKACWTRVTAIEIYCVIILLLCTSMVTAVETSIWALQETLSMALGIGHCRMEQMTSQLCLNSATIRTLVAPVSSLKNAGGRCQSSYYNINHQHLGLKL